MSARSRASSEPGDFRLLGEEVARVDVLRRVRHISQRVDGSAGPPDRVLLGWSILQDASAEFKLGTVKGGHKQSR
eukprot:32810-Eustigmatos_ZCMA.PRE.1